MPIHVVRVALQTTKHCRHSSPTIFEDIQETCSRRVTVTMRFTEDVPPDLVEQIITKFYLGHPERCLPAFVHG